MPIQALILCSLAASYFELPANVTTQIQNLRLAKVREFEYLALHIHVMLCLVNSFYDSLVVIIGEK